MISFKMRGRGQDICVRVICVLATAAAALSCSEPVDTPHWRPAYHFTAQRNWMNDPNGLVYLDGEYHLYYQFNPKGNSWGHMSWGHAVSGDLVHWKDLPVALEEEGPCFYPTMMFSGSAVIDRDNTSGLCGDEDPSSCMVAVYTSFTLLEQTQSVAWSGDRGRTFRKYSGNPVLDRDTMHFRDPKVFRYEETGRWIMVVSLPKERKALFYSSEDLKNWNYLSSYGPAGYPVGIWECPDLFRLPVKNEKGRYKWVLVISLGQEGPGPDMQYFIGEFDGKKFSGDDPDDLCLRLDHGYDYYAAISWNNIGERDGRRIMIGWLSNWKYADDVPTHPWRGALSLPREMELYRFSEGYRLVQRPVRELSSLRGNAQRFDNIVIGEEYPVSVSGNRMTGSLEIKLVFSDIAANDFGIKLFAGKDNAAVVGYDGVKKLLYVDRSRSGEATFSDKFREMNRAEAPLDLHDGKLCLDIFIDNSIIEVFDAGGRVVLSTLVYPGSSDRGIFLFAHNGTAKAEKLEVFDLVPCMAGRK